MSFDKCTQLFTNHHNHDIEYFHHQENSLFPLCHQFPPFIVGFRQALIGILSLQFCFFLELHINGIVHNVLFSVCFFPLNAFGILSSCCMCQKFLYCQVLLHCIGITKVIYSPVDGHLGCFQLGAIINKAAMNILFHFFWGGEGHMCLFSQE